MANGSLIKDILRPELGALPIPEMIGISFWSRNHREPENGFSFYFPAQPQRSKECARESGLARGLHLGQRLSDESPYVNLIQFTRPDPGEYSGDI